MLGDHHNGFDGESPVAMIEQILQTGAQQVDNQYVVQAFLAKVIDIRNTGCKTTCKQSRSQHVFRGRPTASNKYLVCSVLVP